MTQTSATQPAAERAIDRTAIRPFTVSVQEEELTDLRHRINATRWPERETVTDATQGVQLATTQNLARYWATEYDWRKCEARLQALPNFITEIDGLDIHFIHVRSKHEIHFNQVPKGGHFAAWEQPQLFSEEVRAGFRSLR